MAADHMIPAQTIRVVYSCVLCGLERADCDVPARGQDVPVEKWIREMLPNAIQRHHAGLSPWCKATTITEVLVPIAGADMIGGVCKE